MSLEGLTGLVDRITAWADRLQRKHGVLGFPYAVIKKYDDDAGGRQAALITYYGFLSIFPLLLLGVAILSRVLAAHPDLRQRLVTVVATALTSQPGLERVAAVLGSALVVFAVLLFGAKLLLPRPAPISALWPGAILGAVAVTVVLNVGPPLLAREQERIPAARVELHLATGDSPPANGSPPASADQS
jgi:hypothetical protein